MGLELETLLACRQKSTNWTSYNMQYTKTYQHGVPKTGYMFVEQKLSTRAAERKAKCHVA